MKNILISFVGSNDAGELGGKPDGAILTALKNEEFDEAILLWNHNTMGQLNYSTIAKEIMRMAIKKKLVKKVSLHQLNISDVTDHNIIYQLLKSFTDGLLKKENIQYTAAISSGTPAMQVCWILLSESGDFSEEYPLRLIKVKDPKFGASANITVKLDTSLPKILRLRKELQNIKNDLFPLLTINIERGSIQLESLILPFSPIEFCYYRYFVERAMKCLAEERFSGMWLSIDFMKTIYKYHEESFPDLDLNREDLRKMIKGQIKMAIQTFRSNISRINSKLRQNIEKDTVYNFYKVSINGTRGAKYYSIKAVPNKIKLLS